MRRLGAALLGALGLAACGTGGGGGGASAIATAQPPAAVPSSPSTPPAPAGVCPHGVAVRLIGTNHGSVSSLSLTPGDVGVTCAPAPACACAGRAQGALDLSVDGAARDLFTFRYPADLAGGAPVTLSAGFIGGTAVIGATRGDLAFCGTSVVFTFDPSRIAPEHCSVTILLDVARSLVPSATGFQFLPQYRVFF